MKNLKLSKIAQIILITLLVCTVAGIIVKIITNNNSLAGAVSKCTDCNIGTLTTSYGNNNDGTHSRIATCSNCGATSDGGTVSCTYANPTYYNNNDGTHTKMSKCVCGDTKNEIKTCSGPTEPKSNENGTHTLITKCTSCGSENEGATSECMGATHENGGVCTECDVKYQEHTMEKTGGNPTGYGSHKEVYSCTYEGCVKQIEGETVSCEWEEATCTEPKKCTVCGDTTGDVLKHDWRPATAGKHRCSMCKDIQGCVMEEATCTEPGKCMECDYEAGEALGHDYSPPYPVGTGKHKKDCNRCGVGGVSDCTFAAATCTEPEKCACGQTRGSTLKHDWRPATAGKHRCSMCKDIQGCVMEEATCTEPGKCMECDYEAGEALGHDYASPYPVEDDKHKRDCNRCGVEDVRDCTFAAATCAEPEKCACGRTRGSASGHDWDTSVKGKHTCNVCGLSDDCEWENNKCIKCWQQNCLHERTYCDGEFDANPNYPYHAIICKDCGLMLRYEKCGNLVYDGDEGLESGHPMVCGACRIVRGKESHTGGTHENGGKCVVCDYEYMGLSVHEQFLAKDISYGPGIDGAKQITGGKAHSFKWICTYQNCKYEYYETEECSGGVENHSGVCDVCKQPWQKHELDPAVAVPIEGTKQHQWISSCGIEGCPYQLELGTDDCRGFSHPDGKCTACHAVREKHEITTTRVGWYQTSDKHTPMYACSIEGCTGKFKGPISDDHSWTTVYDNKNGTHSLVCTVCDYEKKEEHDYKDNQENLDNNFESSKGAATGASLLLEIGEELGTEEIIDESCSKCGALASAEENGCEHTYVEKSDEKQHWEECTKCGYYKKGSLEPHDHTTFTDNGDGTHSSTCTKCEYKKTMEHYFVDGVCEDCEAKPVQGCEHSYVFKSEETRHWVQCSKCNDIISISSENHEYGTYFDNGDGTHSAICKICAYKLTEQHEENCEKCEKATPPDSEKGDEEGDNKEDNKEDDKGNTTTPEAGEKEDNTIADVIIPAAGSPMFIVLVIAILAIVIGIIKLKLKNYKDI